jgi:predicted aspartyl protease/tetratricopeptide (TPR) repeat protein
MRERLLALALTVLAFVAGPERAGAAECNLQNVAEIPVTMAGMEAMVNAKINGQDATFFIDTGAFFSVLNPGSAAKFGLKLGPLDPRFRVEGVTGEASMHVTTVKTLTFMDAPFRDVEFLVGEHGIGPADGLIGQNALGGIDAEYDLADGVVRLFLPKGCGGAVLAYWSPSGAGVGEMSISPINGPDRRIMGTATLNGEKIRVLFDSGASRSVLTEEAARRAGVRLDGPDVIQIGSSSALGGRMARAWIAPFQSFEIGGEQVKATKLRVSDIYLRDVDMLLGADFFLSHRIYFARSQNRAYFTYNGGPVFNLEGPRPSAPTPPPPNPQAQANAQAAAALGAGAPAAAPSAALGDSAEAPTDAAGFSRRAAAEMARHAYDAAIADDSQAIALAPTDAAHFYDRALARLLDRQPVVALADLDQALKLKPDYAAALMLRGQLKLARRDVAGAGADFDATLRVDPNAGVAIAHAYLNAARLADADRVASAYIGSHPRNEDLAAALAIRCRARAFSGQGLDEALKDCNDAIHFRPGGGEVYGSRGLVQLRLGKTDAAISDFNEAIRTQARAPWALYGRGIAEARKGMTAQSAADLAAAVAVAPHIADEAKAAGLTP